MILATCCLLGCTALPPSPSASRLDAHYRLARANSNGSLRSATVDTYNAIAGRALYSSCHWFPSDSQYARASMNRCGTGRGLAKAVGRFLSEPDADRMGYPIVVEDSRIKFVDILGDCD